MNDFDLITAAVLLIGLPLGTFLIGGFFIGWVAAGLAAFFVFLLGAGLAQVLGLDGGQS